MVVSSKLASYYISVFLSTKTHFVQISHKIKKGNI